MKRRKPAVATGKSKHGERMVVVMDASDNKAIAITGYADTSDANFEQSVRDAVAIALLLELLERNGFVEELEAESVRMIGIIKADLEVNQ